MNKAFVLYTEYSQKFRRLTDEQLGKLLRVIFQYEETGEVPDIDDQFVAFAFDIVQPDLEKQYEKYQAKSNAGKRSGEQRKRTATNSNEQNGTNTNTGEQNEQNTDMLQDVQPVQVCCTNKKEKEKEKKKEKEKEIKKEIPKEKVESEVLFEQFERSPYAPELVDVQEFFALKGLTVSPDAFFHHYEAMNWKIGGQYINDWKSLARSWDAQERQKRQARAPAQSGTGSKAQDALRRIMNGND